MMDPHRTRRDSEGLFDALWSLARTRIAPRPRHHLPLGWLILVALGLQFLTGVLLSFYYEAGGERAADSLRFIARDVDFGWLVRGVHHWGSSAILVLGLLQLVRALATRSWRGGGESCWYLGFFLLALLFAAGLSGDLLPWDDRAFWTATRSMEVVAGVPWIGPSLATLLRGGPEVSSHALSRIHAVHTLVLPALTAGALVLVLWFLARRRRAEGGGGR